MFDIKDKTIVITGGGGVLCGTMARALAREGARVAVLDINETAARGVAEQCGPDNLGLSADVLDRASVERAAQVIQERFGSVDILINGAGGNKKEATTSDEMSFFDLPPDAIQWVMNLNLVGTIIPCQVFGRIIAEREQGKIINISSMNAFRPLTRIPAYSAAKAAVSNFTTWLAVHMAQNCSTNIRVNAVAPGFFLTQQNRFLLIDEKTGQLTPRGQTIIDHTPLKEFGRPEDLEGVILWLCSDASRFVHGAVIAIDGGFQAFSGV